MDESGSSTASSLWNQSSEPKSEIDSGMMPPPLLPPITARRPSLVGSMSNDQISPPNCGLKAEMMDENSQNSMGSDQNSMDRFPGSNENSIDTSMYTMVKRRNSTIDMMEENSNMSIIVNDNTMDVGVLHMNQFNNNRIEMMPTANDLKVLDLCVKQEEIAAQIQNLVQNNQNQMLSDLNALKNSTVNQLNTHMEAPSIYNTNHTNSNVVFAPNMISTTSTTTSPTIYENMCRETGVNQMNQMSQSNQPIDIESISNSSESMMGSPSSATSNRSPHAQDIILNSQSSVLNGNESLQSVLSSPTNSQSQHSISPDIILNPSVSPSMMCPSVTDANLLSPQGTLSNPILNTLPNISVIPTMPTITQTTQDAILNNLIPSVITQQNETQTIHMSRKTTPVAVKNMYLKAANEILTSQPTESTINALISMDQTMYNETQPSVTVAPQNNMQSLTTMFNGQDQLTNHQMMVVAVAAVQNNLASQQQQEAANVMEMNNVSMTLLNQAVNEQQMQRVQEELIRVATTNNLV